MGWNGGGFTGLQGGLVQLVGWLGLRVPSVIGSADAPLLFQLCCGLVEFCGLLRHGSQVEHLFSERSVESSIEEVGYGVEVGDTALGDDGLEFGCICRQISCLG